MGTLYACMYVGMSVCVHVFLCASSWSIRICIHVNTYCLETTMHHVNVSMCVFLCEKWHVCMIAALCLQIHTCVSTAHVMHIIHCLYPRPSTTAMSFAPVLQGKNHITDKSLHHHWFCMCAPFAEVYLMTEKKQNHRSRPSNALQL